MIEQVTTEDLRRLETVVASLTYKTKHATPFNLSKRQRTALNAALRDLDFGNRYSTGDKLRTAFGVELDAVKANRKRHGYGKDC